MARIATAQRLPSLAAAAAFLPLAGTAPASEGTWTSLIQPASNPGYAVVAADGNVAVVADPYDDSLGVDAGRAWVYERVGSNWTLAATLDGSTPQPNRLFGHAADVSGDRIVVAAPTVINHPGLGWVEVVDRVGGVWTRTATLTPSDPKPDRHYGCAVAVHGDRVAVGADHHDALGPISGAVYVHDRVGPTWVETKVVAADADSHDRFGAAVDLGADTLAVGAPEDEAHSFLGGSAYVFEPQASGWIQRYKLVPPATSMARRLGLDVALAGGLMAVGAWGTPYVVETGASGWTGASAERVIAGAGSYLSDFGQAVAIADGKVYVGAPGHGYPAWSDEGFWCHLVTSCTVGCVFRFEKLLGAWRPTARWAPTLEFANSYMGGDVAVAGNQVLAAVALGASVAVCEEPPYAPAFGSGWRPDLYMHMPLLLCVKDPPVPGGSAAVEVYRSHAPFFLAVGAKSAIIQVVPKSADPFSVPAELYLAPLLALIGPFGVDLSGSAHLSAATPIVPAPLELVVQALSPHGPLPQSIHFSNAVRVTLP